MAQRRFSWHLADGSSKLRAGDLREADGAFAEYLCDLAESKPADLSFEQAAAVPLAASTALVGLREVGAVRPGHRDRYART